jgi:hypothetical protein
MPNVIFVPKKVYVELQKHNVQEMAVSILARIKRKVNVLPQTHACGVTKQMSAREQEVLVAHQLEGLMVLSLAKEICACNSPMRTSAHLAARVVDGAQTKQNARKVTQVVTMVVLEFVGIRAMRQIQPTNAPVFRGASGARKTTNAKKSLMVAKVMMTIYVEPRIRRIRVPVSIVVFGATSPASAEMKPLGVM